MNTAIDLNADVGEGGAQDEALFSAGITSANVACGGHAGDETTMAAACERCARHGVALGGHPGFADREHFGRRERILDEAALECLVREQVGALREVAARHGGLSIRHVKPHGALYHLLNRDARLAARFVAVVHSVASGARIYGPPSGELREAAGRSGVGFIAEGFMDRAYQPDGTLVPRGEPGACLDNEQDVVAQALRLAVQGAVGTLCVHGDGESATRFLSAAKRGLGEAGFRIAAPVRAA
jgi:UPF0271 protein